MPAATAVGAIITREEAQDGRLAGAVRANETDALALGYGERDVEENILGAEGPLDVFRI